MRVAIAMLVAVLLGAPLAPVTVQAASAGGLLEQQQPTAQPQQQTAPAAQQDDADITSAGWANILWIVVVLVVGVAFVWLAMVGLRTRTRE